MNNEEMNINPGEEKAEAVKAEEKLPTEKKKLSKGAIYGIIGGAVAVIAAVVILLITLLGGKTPGPNPDGDGAGIHINYADQVKLDLNSSTMKQEVTVKMHIDGDTTHFYVPKTIDSEGYIKARYLAINTPESTGKIEEWGKLASRFTKEKLLNAHSIMVESDSDHWNFDGNGRYLVWVWYKPTADSEYRNLNIEILEAGLAVGSKTSDCRYGDIAVKAIAQATKEKLYVFSDNKDPEYPYGAAASITLKELRINAAEYDGAKVSLEGIVTYNSNSTVYVEEYDADSDMYYGMQVFLGYNASLETLLAQGSRVRIVGVVSQFSGTWQISGLSYNPMKPNDPANTAKLSDNNPIPFTETSIDRFYGKVNVTVDDEIKTYNFTELAVSSSISMKNLKVVDIYTTKNGSSAGAMTLTCRVDGKEIDVRTEVLKDANGNVVTESYFANKTIDVKGIIDYFDLDNTGNGTYQIKLYSLDDVVVH